MNHDIQNKNTNNNLKTTEKLSYPNYPTTLKQLSINKYNSVDKTWDLLTNDEI